MVTIPFLKKIQFPKLDFKFAFGPASFVGIDIGSDAVKVVQLRKERERAILETYGELKTGRYFQKDPSLGGGFLSHSDQILVEILGDVLRESNVTTRRAVFGIPATSSFVILINFPLIGPDEIQTAIQFEAKKYIPIPVSEVAIDWQILETNEAEKKVEVLLVAVPREVVSKCERLAKLMSLDLAAVEIESFSLVRSLLSQDRGVSAIMHWGAAVTTIIIAVERRIRASHNFGHGSQEITNALAQSLGISRERAEAVKKEAGLSEKPEDREVVAVISPIVDSTLLDLERVMVNYNRGAGRKVEKIILTGGGASLAGLAGHVAKRFGLETALGNPFSRTVFPAFLQPVLKDIAPDFAVAVGLALRPITA